MKKFISEFKEFIAKGDVMSMAVGIIIGGAFTSIVNSLVGDVITPLLGIILGGINFIQAVITFLLTALVIFSIMKLFNSFRRKSEPDTEPVEKAPAEPSEDVKLLTEIRDLLKNKN